MEIDIDSALRRAYYNRLRRPGVSSTVPGSLPIVAFGDIFAARIVTIALNPSPFEYLSQKNHEELTGAKRRFETLASLGASSRISLTEDQCDKALRVMREYYQRAKSVYRYFRHLENVLGGLGASYYDGSAAHLDLVQEATWPAWSELQLTRREEVAELLRLDLPFLRFQLESHKATIFLCNGKAASQGVQSLFSVEILGSEKIKRINCWFGRATLKEREIALAGWNYPLDKATGLGNTGERELGQLIRKRLSLFDMKAVK
jgi:hypothetical protein